MRVTIHDQFKRGDTVRLGHVESGAFVTEYTLAVERDALAVTFASVPFRSEVEVIIGRAAEVPSA